MTEEVTTITARELLLAFMELRSMCPEFDDWTEERLADNPPRLVRLRRLKAMFQAFDIPWDPFEFAIGSFIDAKKPRYAAVLSRLIAEFKKGKHRDRHFDVCCYFSHLYEYREKVNSLLDCFRGAMEVNGTFLLASAKVGKLSRVIRKNMGVVDDDLLELISPERKSFSVTELIQNYSYPDDDLFEIDIAWF